MEECGFLDTEQAFSYLHGSWELCFSLRSESPRYSVQYILKLRGFVPALLFVNADIEQKQHESCIANCPTGRFQNRADKSSFQKVCLY